MTILGFPISLEVLGLFLVVLGSLVKYLKQRVVFPRLAQSAPQPILGVVQLPHELAEIRHFAPLYPRVASPVIVHRRQFSTPGSPNQQVLAPRQRQALHGHRRHSYRDEYPISASLLASPFLPSTPPSTVRNSGLYGRAENALRGDEFTTRLPVGPPRSPLACRTSNPSSPRVNSPIHAETLRPSPASPSHEDVELPRRLAGPPRSPWTRRLNSHRVDSLIQPKNGPRSPVSLYEDVEFTKRLLAGPPRSPLAGRLGSPVAQTDSDSPIGLFVERQHPARSPLVPTAGSAIANTGLPKQESPAGLFVERLQHDLTSPHLVIDPVLRSPELSHPQTIPSDAPLQSIASTSLLLPSPIPADQFVAPSRPPQQTVRRAPSFSPRVRSPVPMSESNARKMSKKVKSRSMVFPPPASPATSRICVVSAVVTNSASNVSTQHALHPEAAAGETVEEHLSLADVHNTPPPAPTLKKVAVELPDGQASRRRSALGSPTKIPVRIGASSQIAALFSPTKAPRRFVDGGPSPVYHYCLDAPVAVVAKSIVRSAQSDFKNFSATLGARFKQKGWAAAGPNELAAEKRKGKKKKRVGVKDAQAN